MKEINPALQDMINNKRLSEKKISLLIFLKKYIDRVASLNYLPDDKLKAIETKYGVAPDIITWGDYFQTQVAGQHWEKSEEEFENIIEIIHYDVIASVMIFTGKDSTFCNEIRSAFLEASGKYGTTLNSAEEEALHMGILLNYFEEMGLELSRYTEEDFTFFKQYSAQEAAS